MRKLLTKASYDSRALPIQGKRVALYGAGATHTIKGGTGSGEVNERHSVTVLEGMKQAGFEITTKRWLKDCKKLYQKGLEEFQRSKWKNVIKNPMSLLADYPGTEGSLIDEADIKESDTENCVYAPNSYDLCTKVLRNEWTKEGCYKRRRLKTLLQ